jgi:hypothetical protein
LGEGFRVRVTKVGCSPIERAINTKAVEQHCTLPCGPHSPVNFSPLIRNLRGFAQRFYFPTSLGSLGKVQGMYRNIEKSQSLQIVVYDTEIGGKSFISSTKVV